MRLGPFTLHTIECGRIRLDGGAMFGIVPKVLWVRRMPTDDRNRITMHMRALLIEGLGRVVLIDNGAGDKYGTRFRDMFALEGCTLDTSLAHAGFQASDVTDVILTHLHFDHAGGSTQWRRERAVPRFPNATYYIQRAQLQSARQPNERERASFLPENFEPMATFGQLCELDGNRELLPGIEVFTVNGHTDAQQLVRIIGAEGTLVYVADLLPTVHHLRGPWVMAYDVRPMQTLNEKRTFLHAAHSKNWHLFFEHDPNVTVSSLKQGDRGIEACEFRPLDELF